MTAALLCNPLLEALREPRRITEIDEATWRDLIGMARQAGLLARLAILLEEYGGAFEIPEKAQHRLEDARVFERYNQTKLSFEINRLSRALSQIETSVILLKGAAYLSAHLPPARGRIASDIDILVPKPSLPRIEQALREAGWERAQLTDYDERYYREWMHEIPPMWHPERRVVVDIHHTIVPVTSRYQPMTNALFEAAVELSDPLLKVLCPADMVLHSAVHLFNEEMTHGLRGLVDLYDLLEHFGKNETFWGDLLRRAHVHGFERPLFYTIHHTEQILATAVPSVITQEVKNGAPSVPIRQLTNHLMGEALTPPIPGRARPARGIALWLLLVRSHWLKMPPSLLARHLSTKAFKRWRAWLDLTRNKSKAM